MSDDRATRRTASRPAAVLWDMDGTLVDTEPYWIACEYELVGEHGGTWTDEHAHAIVGLDLRDAAAYISKHGEVDMPIDDIVNRLLDGVILRVRDAVPWRPGARELLRELRRNRVPCALVTMSWRRFAEAVVAALPPGSFELLVTGDEVSHGKPHPEPYRLAASSLGVAAKDCIALEDSPTGVRSAVDAGCVVYAIPNVVDVPPGPGYTRIDSLRDLDVATLGAAAESAHRKRLWLAIAGVVTLIVIAVIAVVAGRGDMASPAPPDIAIDAWAPYWALDVSTASVAAHGTWLRDLSPFWFTATGATQIVTDPNLDATAGAALVASARREGAKVVPSIFDGMAPGAMAAVLADPTQRAAHIQTLVAFVTAGGYDGVDIDYESFAFDDGRSTWDATRPNWVAFITELAAPLHAIGKTLTVSVPPILDSGHNGDSGYWVYDDAAIAPAVDHLRVMAYDYSTNEPGPIAPLDYVTRAITATKDAVHDDAKIVLGVGLHGYNWPVATSGTCPAGTATGRTGVSEASVDDLLAKRQATSVHDPITGEAAFTYQATFADATTSCTQTREVNYIDAEGARERINLARTEHLGGVSLWALGYDSPATWAQIGTLAAPDNGAGTTTVAPAVSTAVTTGPTVAPADTATPTVATATPTTATAADPVTS